ncbi:unnamed protein product, partial [Meganyctiphanes norvegica]
MGDFKYSNVSSVSSISTETYVINTANTGVFYSSATDGPGCSSSSSNSTVGKMQDDCLVEQQTGGAVKPGLNTVDDDQTQQQQHTQDLSDQDAKCAGVNGEAAVVGSQAGPGTNPGPASVLGPPGSVGPPSAQAAAAAAAAAAAVAAAGGPGSVGGPGTGQGLVEPTALPASLASSVASLWSPPSVDDALLHTMPNINGSLGFPGLSPGNHGHGGPGGPGGPSPLFSTSLAPQLGLGHTTHQNPQQRRNLQQTAPQSVQGFPGQSHSRPQSLGHGGHTGPQAAPFLPNKYSSWSSGLGSQGNAWSPGPSPQGNSGGPGGGPSNNPAGGPSIPGMSSWSAAPRGRGSISGMTGMNMAHNMSGMSMQQRNSSKVAPNASSLVMQNKFRRSTSYPGKGPFPHHPPTFEITGVDDTGFPRDLLQFQMK